MPTTVPVPDKSAGDVFTEAMWDSYIKDNVNKLLDRGHRVLTVAQFAALTGLEGTKGTVAPDEVYLEVDAANGIIWHLAYESGEATYKWRFLGGPPMISVVTTQQSPGVTTVTDLATVGPTLSLPRSGDYEVDMGAKISSQSAAGVSGSTLQLWNGTTAEVDSAFRVEHDAGSANAMNGWMKRILTGMLASWTLRLRYQTGATTGYWKNRTLCVRPVRIRHDA